MRISDWSSDVCSSDLILRHLARIDEDRGNWPLFQNSGDIRVHLRMREKRQRKCTLPRQTAQTRQRPGNIAQDKPGAGGHRVPRNDNENGRASCWASGGKYVNIPRVAKSSTKKTKKNTEKK